MASLFGLSAAPPQYGHHGYAAHNAYGPHQDPRYKNLPMFAALFLAIGVVFFVNKSLNLVNTDGLVDLPRKIGKFLVDLLKSLVPKTPPPKAPWPHYEPKYIKPEDDGSGVGSPFAPWKKWTKPRGRQ